MNSVAAIISRLEHAKERLPMYTSNGGRLDCARSFLDGFDTACVTLGCGYGKDTRNTVLNRRGWERRGSLAELVSRETGLNMKDSGMSEQEIITELFAIEIECWREVPGQSISS